MVIDCLNSNTVFDAKNNESILQAALRFGVVWPYSCQTGRCSACKCRIRSGITRPLLPETGLTDREVAEGWVLACVRVAETDLCLDAGIFADVELPTPKTWPCRIHRLDFLAPDVVKVTLRLPPGADFRFLAGQYVNVLSPTTGEQRSYSLAAAHVSGPLLELHIRAFAGGTMTRYWFEQAKPQDLLRFRGPFGTFFLRDVAGLDLVFLATGTGIAPVKAMLEQLVDDRLAALAPRSVTVLWGGRQRPDLYLDMAQWPGMPRIIPVLSRPDSSWTGATGHVQDVLLAMQPAWERLAVYACGSEAMIRTAKSRLLAAGLPEQRFHADAFVRSGAAGF